jgi:hypothetical protein
MSTLKPAVNSTDHHQGNVNASITLVEYGDFECPYCGRAHPLGSELFVDGSSSNRHDNGEKQSIRSSLEAIAVHPTGTETEESWIYFSSVY